MQLVTILEICFTSAHLCWFEKETLSHLVDILMQMTRSKIELQYSAMFITPNKHHGINGVSEDNHKVNFLQFLLP